MPERSISSRKSPMAIVAGVWGKFEPGNLGLWQLFRNDRLGSRLVACLSIFLKCCCRSGWERPSLHRRLCWDLGVLPTYQLADAQAVVVSQCVYQENGLLQVSQGDRGNLEIAYQDMRLRDHRAFRPILVSSFVICSVASTALAAFGCMCFGGIWHGVLYASFPEEAHDRHLQATRSSRSSISTSLPAAWMWLD